MQIRLIAAAAAAIAIFASAPAAAQYSMQDYQALQRASMDVYETCIISNPAIATDAGCACAAGYIGGSLTDREFDIVARLGRIGVLRNSGASEAEVTAEIDAYLAAGYTVEDGQAATARLNAVSARGDAICRPYEAQRTS